MPYRDIEWAERTVSITGADGKVMFSAKAEVPADFSDTAATVVAAKYLYNSARADGTRSMKTLIDRVSEWITEAGDRQGYFGSTDEKADFCWWLKFVQSHKLAGFNSPVYFNAGSCPDPQLSACFINSLDDTMDSITDLVRREAVIFKSGSGSGVNYSNLRSSREAVQKAGNASGPVSFLRVHDRLASEIKSGGVVRRSARMAVLDVDHGDIEHFIGIKAHEEAKLNALRAAGIEPFMGNSLPDEVGCQNTNLSVRMNDKFIDAVKKNGMWYLMARDGRVLDDVRAKDLMHAIAESAWKCAEPGVHFSDNINAWNTASHEGEIVASNPCSEFMFLNDSACNLAAVNLLGFIRKMHCHPCDLHYEDLMIKVIETMITAQDIIVDAASYPNEKIAANSHRFRPLGLGFTNLAASLMLLGLPYDSDAGREQAAVWMDFIALCAHRTSRSLARKKGPYEGYNAEAHGRVLERHALADSQYKQALAGSRYKQIKYYMQDEPTSYSWKELVGEPMRNAQLTLLAPCGTMGFLLDNMSTGIEPFFSHVMHKRLAGGGTLKIVNPCVAMYMSDLGIDVSMFDPETGRLTDAASKLLESGRLVNSSGRVISPAELSVDIFATSQDISWESHLKMMAAVQPFLSGSISKCVTGDTLVPTEGGLVRIGDLADSGQLVDTYKPISIFVESLGTSELATSLYYGGVKETIRLELEDGRELIATPNHMIQVETEEGTVEWRRMDELSRGDRALVKLTSSWDPDAEDSSYNVENIACSLCDQKHLPNLVFRGSYADASALLNKMIDDPSSDHPKIYCKHSTMARDIQVLYGNLGELSIVYRVGSKWVVELGNTEMYRIVNEFENGDVFSVPVYSTEYRYAEVFDFVVPSNHTFVGNGFVNHNTVNMPSSATVQDIEDCYLMAHGLGLKSVIPYRDGSKAFQVLTTKKEEDPKAVPEGPKGCTKQPLPSDRAAWNHKFSLNGGTFTGYATFGEYPDGRLGEMFLRMSKEGSTIGGLLDALATVFSVALQHNVPLEDIVSKMIYRRFEPAGMTSNQNIPIANSVVDYVFKYIAQRYLSAEKQAELGVLPPNTQAEVVPAAKKKASSGDGACPNCGATLYRLGSCLSCRECAWNGGSCS